MSLDSPGITRLREKYERIGMYPMGQSSYGIEEILMDVEKLLENYTHNEEVPNCDDCEVRRLDERPMP